MSNVISSSNYDIEEKLLDLAGNFFDTTEVSTLKTGMLGFSIASFSQISRENIFHRNMLYKERFLNSASLPSSIYQFAKLYNYSVVSAVPSRSTASIAVPLDYLVSEMEANSANWLNGTTPQSSSFKAQFVLNRNKSFMMDKYEFKLPYSVRIVGTRSGGVGTGYSFTARYDVLSEVGIVGSSSSNYNANPFIKAYTETFNFGERDIAYLFLIADLYQLTEVQKVWDVYSNDITEILFFDYVYKDFIADFNVSLTRNGLSEIIPKFFNSSSAVNLNKYVFYNFPDDTSLQLSFSAVGGGFRPQVGDKIQMNMYTTLGSKGNFSFSGNIQYTDYTRIPLITRAISQPAGGIDRLDLKSIKKELIDIATLRGNIISTEDLNIFFKAMITSRDPNANILFQKKRDDIIQRVFSAYILLKDPDGYYIPSNTVSMKIPYSTIEERNFVFKLGSIVIFDVTTDEYRFLRYDEYPEKYLSDPNAIAYAIPYLMELKLSPPRISFVDMNVNEDVALDFKYSNDAVSRDFILSGVKIDRNPLSSSTYTMSCNLLASGKDFDQTKVKIIVAMTSGGSKVCWFEMDYDNVNASYLMHFETDDEFNSAGKLRLKQFGSHKMYSFANTELPEITVFENVDFTFGIMYETASPSTWGSDPTHDELRGVNITMLDSSMSNANFDLAIKMKSANSATFFKLMNDVMHSQVTTFDSDVIQVSDIPLVGLRYFYNTQKNSTFYRTVNNHVALIRDNLDRLENNFDVDLKLYNTYGRSMLYDTSNVHISIDLSIRLKVAYSVELDQKIKDAIKNFIVASNDTTTRKMSISNLNTFLENNFSQISHIIFNGVNGLNIQAINYIYTPEQMKEQKIRSAPEYLNVALVDAGANAVRSSEPNIKITYI
jgi:hypothetical protein